MLTVKVIFLYTFEFMTLQFDCVFNLEKLSPSELERIKWILTPNFESKLSAGVSSLRAKEKTSSSSSFFVEIGPRLNFSTALSTNAVSICTNIGLVGKVGRIEKSTLYLFELTV